MHLGSKNFVSSWREKTGQELVARARTAPFARGKVHDWELLEGNDLDEYLREGYAWRNQLAHTGTPDALDAEAAKAFGSRFYRPAVHLDDGSVEFREPTVNLNLAEGMLQAAQDIAYLTATPEERSEWTWALPRWTDPGNMPDGLAFDRRFALPPEIVAWARGRDEHDPNGWR
ncbi:hypothetical protein [Nocardia sp. NPDC059195]|uniref:hypothetical protein n=1 Tax=Nocardia sp. NPDC059195 TaxID=3346765 RepID=UPI0036CDED9D